MMKNQTDEDLFKAYRNNNMQAFDELYARYRQPLFLFLLRRGHEQAVAEDIFHDAWLRILNHHQLFDGENFRAWLYSIARNLSTDIFRQSKIRVVDSLDHENNLQTEVSTQRKQEGIDCVELIKSSIATLPMDQRDVFLLQHEAGLTLQQIAELMAVGRETIKSRIRYAMKRLKQLMEECL